MIVVLLLVKLVIWSVSLGSGTSGGVLAPLLLMGGALGGVEALILPDEGTGFWPLVSMGAILGGTMRSPFGETSEALFLTQGFVYDSAESCAARFKGEEPGYLYSRFSNPTVAMFEQRMIDDCASRAGR